MDPRLADITQILGFWIDDKPARLLIHTSSAVSSWTLLAAGRNEWAIYLIHVVFIDSSLKIE
jgi:hypothetical protein